MTRLQHRSVGREVQRRRLRDSAGLLASGLAHGLLLLGVVLLGSPRLSATTAPVAIVVEIVFSYPGLGTLTLNAIQNRDYFLIQGIFLFLIVGVLIANFIIDIAYVFIDPRTRIGMQGGA